MTVDRERRDICRECGRGAAAPHMSDCFVGLLRTARANFNLNTFLRRYNDQKDNER